MRNAMSPSRRVTQPTEAVRESAVQQNEAADADINNIVGKHVRGIGKYDTSIPIGYNPMATRKPMFIEVPSQSFHDAMNMVTRVRTAFERLPSKIRNRFMNSPAVLLDFVQDPQNRQECLELGFVLPETDADYEHLKKVARGRTKTALAEQLDIQREIEKENPDFPKPDDEANPKNPNAGVREKA